MTKVRKKTRKKQFGALLTQFYAELTCIMFCHNVNSIQADTQILVSGN